MSEKFQKFEEKYNELKEKYSLPSLDELNNEFDLTDAIKTNKIVTTYPLRYTRRVIVNAFYGWINYLHNFIMPNPQSAIMIRESESFSEEQKNEVVNLIKEIMFINRISAKLDLEMSEEKNAEFIKQYFEEWKKLKGKLLELAQINIDGWKKDIPKDKEMYFG